MRQKHETAKSFNELKAITQAIMLRQPIKTASERKSERTQTSENANISDRTQKTGLKPKTSVQAQKGRLNPTRKAFSERQKTTFRDSERTQKRANALKTPKNKQANNSNFKNQALPKRGQR
ncbi:hypothetical protein ACQKBX_05685 [Helicobacter pylori]